MQAFNELSTSAGVAELADAQDLGSCGLKTVEVQLLSPAPKLSPQGWLCRFPQLAGLPLAAESPATFFSPSTRFAAPFSTFLFHVHLRKAPFTRAVIDHN